MAHGPYLQSRSNARRASTSSSLVSCTNFANRTVSRLDLVEKDYSEWNAIQANRERLLRYKSELVKINSCLMDIDYREAQLTANVARKHQVKGDELLDSSRTGYQERDLRARSATKRPVFIVPARKKPVLIQPGFNSRSGVRSSHASLRGMAKDYSIPDVPVKHSSEAEELSLSVQRKVRSTRFAEYLSDMIDGKVDRAIDAKLVTFLEEHKLPGCDRLAACEDVASNLPLMSEGVETIVARSKSTEVQVADIADSDTEETHQEPPVVESISAGGATVIEELPGSVGPEDAVDASACVTATEATKDKCVADSNIVKSVNSATQTRYSSFAPLQVKQKRIGLTVEKRKTYQPANSPYMSHDELARMAQRLSSTSLVNLDTAKVNSGQSRFLSGANIYCCESQSQHVQTCPSNTSLPLHTIQRARPVRLHKPSPLSLEFRHRTLDPNCTPVQRRPVNQNISTETISLRDRRRAKQDSSVSLGIKMQDGHAFDNQQKWKYMPLAIKSRTGRGKLRKILFGI